MKSLILIALLLFFAFIPFLRIGIYEIWIDVLKKLMPELFWEVEKAVSKSGLPKTWEFYLLIAFSLTAPLGGIYLLVAYFFFKISMVNFVLISVSPFLVYGYVYLKGAIRFRNINNDVRQVYRVLRLVLTAGGAGEDAISKAIKYTSDITPSLEGLLINWGSAEDELMKMKDLYKTPEVDALVSFIFEVKRSITPRLVTSIERQERSLGNSQSREIQKANKRDEAFSNAFYFLFLFSQFYLLVQPLIVESTRVFTTF